MRTLLKHLGAAVVSIPLAMSAQAHDGHGLSGLHPHADLLAPALALAAVAALGLWLMRRK